MDGLNNFTWVKIGYVIFYRLGGGVEDFFFGGGGLHGFPGGSMRIKSRR